MGSADERQPTYTAAVSPSRNSSSGCRWTADVVTAMLRAGGRGESARRTVALRVRDNLHTLGMVSFLVHSGADELLLTANLAYHPVVNGDRPWGPGPDRDKETVLQSRRRILTEQPPTDSRCSASITRSPVSAGC
jgi:hypothetical protein